MNNCRDIGTPTQLAGALGEYAGKVQQTCNGRLVTVAYELHVIADVDGCLCCENPPFVYSAIEILAPEKLIVFQTYQMPLPNYGGDPNQQMGYDPNQQMGYNPNQQMGYDPNQQMQYAPQEQIQAPPPPDGQSPDYKAQNQGADGNKLDQKNVEDTPMEPSEDV